MRFLFIDGNFIVTFKHINGMFYRFVHLHVESYKHTEFISLCPMLECSAVYRIST